MRRWSTVLTQPQRRMSVGNDKFYIIYYKMFTLDKKNNNNNNNNNKKLIRDGYDGRDGTRQAIIALFSLWSLFEKINATVEDNITCGLS